MTSISDIIWYPHYDSNVDLLLRTEMFYPLNYRDLEGRPTAALLLVRFWNSAVNNVLLGGFVFVEFTRLKP